jgi:hypothetical protein
VGFVKDALECVDWFGACGQPYFNMQASALSKAIRGNRIFLMPIRIILIIVGGASTESDQYPNSQTSDRS